jgi:AraC-like DNA-binding protein
MLNGITQIIALITVAQLFLFSAFLITGRKNKNLSRVLLSFFLLVNGIYILNYLAAINKSSLIAYSVDIFHIGGSFGFLFGPLLFLYTRSVTEKEFRFSSRTLFHLIPFIIVFVLILVNFQLQPYDVKLQMLNNRFMSHSMHLLYTASLNGITLAYLAACFVLVLRRNEKLKSYYSSLDRISFDWLILVITAFFTMWLVDLTNWLLGAHESRQFSEILSFLSLFINFVFANLLILKSLRLTDLQDEIKASKYEGSSLTAQQKTTILDNLESIMCNEKLYLDPDINLGDMAQKVSVSPRYLSQVINELKGQNFYDYINNYRIEEAKQKLSNPSCDNEKILGILLDCGFNSKSVFNTVFKKTTGFTPSEYRKRYRRTA